MIVLAAANNAAAEPNAGWGKLCGLLVAVGLFWLFTTVYGRWQAAKDEALSPSGETAALEGAKSQVTGPGDTDLTPAGEGSPTGDDDLDGFVSARVGKAQTKKIVNDAQGRFRVSRSTVMRAIRRARGGQS